MLKRAKLPLLSMIEFVLCPLEVAHWNSRITPNPSRIETTDNIAPLRFGFSKGKQNLSLFKYGFAFTALNILMTVKAEIQFIL